MPKAPSIKRVLQTFVWLIENQCLEGIKPSSLQSELDIDRTTIRMCMDSLVDAEVATVNIEGITRVYALNVKLPKTATKGPKLSKEQVRAQKDIEARAFQDKVRFSKSPSEPQWVILPKFYHDLSFGTITPEDIYEEEINGDWLAGVCPDCKQSHIADDFDKRQWRCRACAKAWLNESCFRADSEGELID